MSNRRYNKSPEDYLIDIQSGIIRKKMKAKKKAGGRTGARAKQPSDRTYFN